MNKNISLLGTSNFKPFVMPVLTSNGVLGGNVPAMASYSAYNAGWGAAYTVTDRKNIDFPDNFLSNGIPTLATPQWITFYNPKPILVTGILCTNCFYAAYVRGAKSGSILLSNDNVSWNNCGTINNANDIASSTWLTPVKPNNMYKYIRFNITDSYDQNAGVAVAELRVLGFTY